MSLEAKMEALTLAVVALTAAYQSTTNTAPSVAPIAQVPMAAPAPAMPAPVAPVAPQMPAPPTFMATPAFAAPVAAGAPFSDGKGLVDYVMNKYKALGAEKGAQIQNVLGSLGYQNINDVKPEHYAALYQGVEALG